MIPTRPGAAAAMLAAGILSFTSGCGGSKGPEPLTGDHAFTLVYSQANLGNIEPCTCNNRTVGGFPRRVTALNAIRDEAKGSLLVLDAGDTLFAEDDEDKLLMMPQAKRKARAIAEALVTSGLDAMTFGPADLAAGGTFFKQIVADTGLPVLAANAIDRRSGRPVFDDYEIFERDGVKIAVLGLVAPEAKPLFSEENSEGTQLISPNPVKSVFLEELFEDLSVKIEDPLEVARDLVPKLRTEAHLVVLLSHLSRKLSREMPDLVPGIDFVVGSHAPSNHAEYHILDNSMYLSSSMNGTSLGRVDFAVKDGALLFADHTRMNRSQQALPNLQTWLEEITEQFGSIDPDRMSLVAPELATKIDNVTARIEETRAELASALRNPESGFVLGEIVLDGREHRDDPKMIEHVRAYRRSLQDVYEAEPYHASSAILVEPGSPHYVTDKSCRGCHAAQTEFWERTSHARAWQTMIDEDAVFDLECIQCHTVGFMERGGFDRPDRVAGFEDVQCENCHGPGSEHVTPTGFLDPDTIVGRASLMRCESCHNNEHSPDFKRETYVPRIACPPIDPRETMIRGLYARAAQAMKPRIERKRPSLPHMLSHLELCLRLENHEEALAVAERGLAIYPRASRLTVAKARALDGLGRTSEALQQLHGAYEQSPKSDVIVREMIRQLLHGNDAAARNPTLAAELARFGMTQIDRRDLSFVRFLAEAIHSQGDLAAAIQVLDEVLDGPAGEFSELLDYRDALAAEERAMAEYAVPPPLAVPPPQ